MGVLSRLAAALFCVLASASALAQTPNPAPRAPQATASQCARQCARQCERQRPRSGERPLRVRGWPREITVDYLEDAADCSWLSIQAADCAYCTARAVKISRLARNIWRAGAAVAHVSFQANGVRWREHGDSVGRACASPAKTSSFPAPAPSRLPARSRFPPVADPFRPSCCCTGAGQSRAKISSGWSISSPGAGRRARYRQRGSGPSGGDWPAGERLHPTSQTMRTAAIELLGDARVPAQNHCGNG